MGNHYSRAVTAGLLAITLLAALGIASSGAVVAGTAATSIAAQSSPSPKPQCVTTKTRGKKKAKRITKCTRIVMKKNKRCVIVHKRVNKRIVWRKKRCALIPTPSTASPPALPPTPTPGHSGGIPDATNTGVPAGSSLRRHDGNLTITTPGTVLDGMDIHGFVSIKAANVTIKRSLIRGGPAGTVGRGVLSITHVNATNYLIEDVTISPATPTPYLNGINVNQAGTINRADISGTVDGIMIYGSEVRVQNSYLHDFRHYINDPNWGGGPSHDDAIQVQAGTNINIVANTLQGAHNAAVMVTQDAGPTTNLSITGNWVDGGGCTFNYGSKGAYKTGMRASNNTFGRNQRNPGCAIIHNTAASDLSPDGNTWADNDQPATIKRGA